MVQFLADQAYSKKTTGKYEQNLKLKNLFVDIREVPRQQGLEGLKSQTEKNF